MASLPTAEKPSGSAIKSSETLDLKDVLLAFSSCDDLFSQSAPSFSTLDSIQSFQEIPAFPSGITPKVCLYLTAFPPAAVTKCISQRDKSAPLEATTTVPTGPRMAAMIMEPICVQSWVQYHPPSLPPDHMPWSEDAKDEDYTPLPWIAQGSFYPPENFLLILRDFHGKGLCISGPKITIDKQSFPPLPPIPGQGSLCPTPSDDGLADASDDTIKLSVPTIMVSNSTAMLPLSLESSQSLTRDVPLAVRRGQKVPPALALTTANVDVASNAKTTDGDSYPGIPSPFLGSPSTSTPTFQYSDNHSASPMGLDAMCADLLSRCPDLCSPGLGSAKTTGNAEIRERTDRSTPTSASSDDSDEWAFAKGLLEEYGEHSPPLDFSGRSSPQVSPTAPTLSPATPERLATPDADFSWATSPTLTCSPEHEHTLPEQTAGSARQQRRKTVIIETPEYRSTVSLPAPCDLTLDNEHGALPFEGPLDPFSCSQCRQSTPPPARFSSRPASSATLRPTRGILKEKKTVRFSVVHSRHEYPSDEHPVVPAVVTLPPPPPGSPLGPRLSPEPLSPDLPGPASHLPKHPAARAIAARGASPVPAPAPPTPALLMEQRRAPLRSINTRQSLPAKRSSQAVFAAQIVRRSIMKNDIPRRLKTASTPPAAKENRSPSVRPPARESASPTKSRMPVPFRSILTKLRA